MGCKAVVLLVLAALSAANAFHKLIPGGQELVYEYKALVKAGTDIPKSHGSEFYLHGKLHIQAGSSYALMHFTDLTYKMWNGREDYEHEHKVIEVPVGPEVADLQKTWKVVYDPTGMAVQFVTENNEKEYTRNIKRAISSIFQIELDSVMKTKKHHAFVTKENTIFGRGTVYYDVFPQEREVIHIHKMHEMKTTHHLYQHVLTNVQPEVCESKFENPLTHDSVREYTIEKVQGHLVAKHVMGAGGVYLHPLLAKSEAQFVHVNQTFELVNIVKISTPMVMTTQHVENNLVHFMIDESETEGPVNDLYLGRRKHDQSKLIAEVDTMLLHSIQHAKENHLTTKPPKYEDAQLIHRLTRIMLTLDQTSLQTIWTKWSQKTSEDEKLAFELFNQVLPFVGTKATTKFILTLVTQNKVKEPVALHLLHNFPLHVKFPSWHLVEQMEPLLDTKTISWNVQKAAVLAFSTLIHKTEKHVKQWHEIKYDIDEWPVVNHGIWESVNNSPKAYKHPEQLQKWVQTLVTGLKSAKTWETKMLYIEALANTRVDLVVPYFEQIITGEWVLDDHLRLLAMWGVYPMIAHNQEKIYELYWPVMTDAHTHTHLRINAYYLIMRSHPTLSRMINIYWHMQQEMNHELYQFHYTYLKEVATSTDPCTKVFRLHCQQVLKYTTVPNMYGIAGYYQMDFTDPKYGFGAMLKGMVSTAKDSVLVKFTVSHQINHIPVNFVTYIVKVHGIEGVNKLELNTKTPNKFFNYEELWQFVTNIQAAKDLHVEVMVLKQNQFVQSYFFDHSNVKELPAVFDWLKQDHVTYVKNMVHVDVLANNKIFLPTEIGFTAMMNWFVPNVQLTEVDVKKEVVNKVMNFHVDNEWKVWSNSIYGLSFYNVFTDVWQGVAKYKTFQSVIPLNMDVTFNPQQQSMKITWKKHQDVTKDVIGFKAHGTSMTYVKDDMHTNVLVKTAPKSAHFVVVSKGEEYRHDYPIMHHVDYITGYEKVVTVFDNERHVTNATAKDLLAIIFNTRSKNYNTPLGHLVLGWWNFMAYNGMMPRPGTGGYLFKMVPNTAYPITSVELSLRLTSDIQHEKSLVLPPMKWNTRATLVTRREEKTLKAWDVNAIIDMNERHTINNLKMQITRIIPGQKDYKICVDGTKKWVVEGVTGHLTVLASQTSEGKCNPEDTILDVTMVGRKSEEQKGEHVSYRNCEGDMVSGPHHGYLPCFLSHDSIRTYAYEIVTKHMPTEFRKFFVNFWDMWKGWNMPHYTFVDEPTEKVQEHHVKVNVTYPVVGGLFTTNVITPNHEYRFEDVDSKEWDWFGVHPDVHHMPQIHYYMHTFGLINYCAIHNETINRQHHIMEHHVPTEWTLYVGSGVQNPEHAVYVKVVEGTHHLALKIVEKSHTVVAMPLYGNEYEVTVDGKKLEKHTETINEEWIHAIHIPGTLNAVMMLKNIGVQVFFAGDHVHIEIPKMDVQWYGHCFQH